MPKTGETRISGQKNTWPCIFMPGVSLQHKYSAVLRKMSRQNTEFSGGGVGNFVKRAQNKPKICDRMTGQTCTKIREQTENRSNLYTKKNDFTAVSKGFGQGFGRSGRGHRPAECRQAEEGASPGKTKEPANARSAFAGSGSSGYTRAAP